jgi:hypothetical protein
VCLHACAQLLAWEQRKGLPAELQEVQAGVNRGTQQYSVVIGLQYPDPQK